MKTSQMKKTRIQRVRSNLPLSLLPVWGIEKRDCSGIICGHFFCLEPHQLRAKVSKTLGIAQQDIIQSLLC